MLKLLNWLPWAIAAPLVAYEGVKVFRTWRHQRALTAAVRRGETVQESGDEADD